MLIWYLWKERREGGKRSRWRDGQTDRWTGEEWVRKASDCSTILRKTSPGKWDPQSKVACWRSPTWGRNGLAPASLLWKWHLGAWPQREHLAGPQRAEARGSLHQILLKEIWPPSLWSLYRFTCQKLNIICWSTVIIISVPLFGSENWTLA